MAKSDKRDQLERLQEYSRSISEFDPDEVAHKKERLAAALQDLGRAVLGGESFTFDFNGKIHTSVDDGKIVIHFTNGDPLMAQMAEAIVGLAGKRQDVFNCCNQCRETFYRRLLRQDRCSAACTKAAFIARQAGMGAEEEEGERTDD